MVMLMSTMKLIVVAALVVIAMLLAVAVMLCDDRLSLSGLGSKQSVLRRSWWFKRSLNVGALGDEITGSMVGGATAFNLCRAKR